MDVQLAVLADSANVSQEGKLNILGQFDTIFANKVPVVWPLLWFVAKVTISAADGRHHRFELRVVDDDGNLIATAEIEGESGDPQIPGALGGGNILLRIANASFAEFGTYVFELRGNGQPLYEVPLHIRPRDEGPRRGA